MKRRVVGVDVTSKSIRAVQMLHKTGQRSIVEKFIEYPLGVSSNDGELTPVQILGGQLKLAFAQAGFKTRDVVFGIGGPDVFVKEFETPDLPKGKLRKLLPELAKGELPMPLDEVVLDYYANRRDQPEGSAEAKLGGILVAASKKIIDLYMEASRVAKLNVLAIDLIPFALTRNLSRRSATPGVRAYVRAANAYINIIVTDGPAISFVRLVPWEHASLNMTPLSSDEDSEGAGIVLEFTDVHTSQITIADGADETQATLHRQAIKELDDTIRYFQRNHPDKAVEEILVSGIRLDNPAFMDMLKSGRDIKVTGVTRSGLGHKRSTVSTVDSSEIPDHLAVALSLAEAMAV